MFSMAAALATASPSTDGAQAHPATALGFELQRLHHSLRLGSQPGSSGHGSELAAPVLPLSIPAIDVILPNGGLALGSVTELQVRGSSGAATSLALAVCRAAQRGVGKNAAHSYSTRAGAPWCAFIDPGSTLFAAGVAQLGVDLERLLIVQPEVSSLERIAVRMAEANVFSVLVVDVRGALGELPMEERRWHRTVRRLSMAIRESPTCVLLLTRANARLSLPLPVALRLELDRTANDAVEIRVGKERTGRLVPPRAVAWSALHGNGSANFEPLFAGRRTRRTEPQPAVTGGREPQGSHRNGGSRFSGAGGSSPLLAALEPRAARPGAVCHQAFCE